MVSSMLSADASADWCAANPFLKPCEAFHGAHWRLRFHVVYHHYQPPGARLIELGDEKEGDSGVAQFESAQHAKDHERGRVVRDERLQRAVAEQPSVSNERYGASSEQ